MTPQKVAMPLTCDAPTTFNGLKQTYRGYSQCQTQFITQSATRGNKIEASCIFTISVALLRSVGH